MTSSDWTGTGDLDATLIALYHAARDGEGRVDPRKVLDDADAYFDEHPDEFVGARRRLLQARLRVIDRKLQVQPDEVFQLSFADDPRYFVVGPSARVEAGRMQPTDWDAWYAIHLENFIAQRAAFAKVLRIYQDVKAAWQPGDAFFDVLRRVLGRQRAKQAKR